MSHYQYEYYKFDCIVLDKPSLRYTDSFFLKIYVNSCLSYDTAFVCGIEVESSNNNVLRISSCSKRTYAEDIVAHVKCLSYLLYARIAIPKTYSLYEDTVLGPIVVHPKIEHVCLFRNCHINVVKVESLLEPDILLCKAIQFALTNHTASKTSFTNLMRFIKHFNITRYTSHAVHQQEVEIVECDTYEFTSMLTACIGSGNEDSQSSSFKEVWKFIRQHSNEVTPALYPASCPLLKHIDRDKLEELKLLRHINEDLYKKEFDELIHRTTQKLEQQNIVHFRL